VDTLLLRWIDEIHFNLLVDRSQPVLRVVYDAARTSAR
jgi:hypothetical protein